MTHSHKFQLAGHSGCKLHVRPFRDGHITVKVSKDQGYNERLRRQMEKQRGYANPTFRAPAVHRAQVNSDGLYEFHMDYVRGKTLAHHLRTVPLSDIAPLVDKLFSAFPTYLAGTPEAAPVFMAKIHALRNDIADKGVPEAFPALDLLEGYDWSLVPSDPCHGDLTLENIILRDNELYLIDFLDSFHESWMIDAAKLYQDVECGWAYRHDSPDVNLRIRLSVFNDLLTRKILSSPRGAEALRTIHHILLLNLIRIVPYAKDDETKHYLSREIARILDKLH